MKVYLVWQHEQYASSWLMGIYADKQQAENMCTAYADPETPDIWYAVEEKEVID
jgi:hypothetical protein